MNHIVIQAVLTVLLGTGVLRVLVAVRKRQIGRRRGLLWLSLWTAALIVVWFPNLTVQIAGILGVGRGVDAVMYVSISILGYMVFRLYAGLEKQDQVITHLVSELALRDTPDRRQAKVAGRMASDVSEIAGRCKS